MLVWVLLCGGLCGSDSCGLVHVPSGRVNGGMVLCWVVVSEGGSGVTGCTVAGW